MSEAVRRGRPPIRGEAKRANFNTRIRAELKALLEQRAAADGRSLSEEIERRLEASFAAEADAYFPEPLRRVTRTLLAEYILNGPGHMASIIIGLPDPKTFEPPDSDERWRRIQALIADLQKVRRENRRSLLEGLNAALSAPRKREGDDHA